MNKPVLTICGLILFLLTIIPSLSKAQHQNYGISFFNKSYSKHFDRKTPPQIKVKVKVGNIEEIKGIPFEYTLVTPFKDIQESKKIELNGEGEGTIVLDYPFPYQEVWLSFSNCFYTGVWVNEGLEAEIDYEEAKRKRVQFTGPGVQYRGRDGKLNEWLNRARMFRRERQLELTNDVNRLNDSLPDYLSNINRLYQERRELETEFCKENPSPFEWMLENERQSDYYGKVLQYSAYYKKVPLNWNIIKDHRPVAISNYGMIFNRALYYYLLITADIDFRTDWVSLISQKLDADITPPYSDMLKFFIEPFKIDRKEGFDERVIANIRTEWCQEVLKSKQLEKQKKIQTLDNIVIDKTKLSTLGKSLGTTPFQAKLIVADTTTAVSFLSNLKSELQGTVIIIDLWATWCKPCIEEMPHGKKRHEEAEDLPLEFVYICTSNNSSVDEWKKTIAELQQPGLHIYAPHELVNELMGMFGKSGFPNYLTFDKNGKVREGVIERMSTLTLEDLVKIVNE